VPIFACGLVRSNFSFAIFVLRYSFLELKICRNQQLVLSVLALWAARCAICASSNDLEHGACLVIGGSGSLFDVKPLGVDVASDGSGLSVF